MFEICLYNRYWPHLLSSHSGEVYSDIRTAFSCFKRRCKRTVVTDVVLYKVDGCHYIPLLSRYYFRSLKKHIFYAGSVSDGRVVDLF